MPNTIDSPPLGTTVPLTEGAVDFRKQKSWATWFQQIKRALTRPTMTQDVTFGPTLTGHYDLFLFQFPLGLIGPNDTPVLTSPIPPLGSLYSVHKGAGDGQVWVFFHNYSGSTISPTPFPEPMTVTILRN